MLSSFIDLSNSIIFPVFIGCFLFSSIPFLSQLPQASSCSRLFHNHSPLLILPPSLPPSF